MIALLPGIFPRGQKTVYPNFTFFAVIYWLYVSNSLDIPKEQSVAKRAHHRVRYRVKASGVRGMNFRSLRKIS